MTDAIRELFELITKKEKSGSDYTGRVTRVDGKTAYVQFDGSDITDTPVALSIGAKAGDSVRVRVADGRAWLVGNDDAPPNDSSEVGYELALTNALIRQLTTEQINGENGWINLLEGTFNYGNKLIWNGRELTLNGKVIATSGQIGGWTIGSDSLYSGSTSGTNAQITLKSGDSGYIRVQNDTAGLTELNNAGFLHQTSSGQINIAGGALTIADRSHYYPSYMLSISSRSISYTETTGGGLKFFIDGTTGAITASSISEGGTTLARKYMGMEVANGYWGLKPNGSNAVYVRTTTLGLIPYQSGGSGTIGTSSWPFSTIYGSTIYEGGTALSSKYLAIRPVSIEFNPPATAGHGGYIDFHFNGSTADSTSRIIEYASGYLLVSGHLQTGSEIVARSGSIVAANGHVRADGTGDVHVYARNTATQCYTSCRSEANGNHGIYSPGYWNGSAFVSSGRYLIYRSYSSGNTCMASELYTYNEGYTSLRPVVGTNDGTNAVGVVVSNASSFGIFGRWAGGATAAMSGRTISCPSSDIRLKKNIADSTVDALSVINRIQIRQFDWKDEARGHWDCGMIVDEMERDIDPKFSIGGEDDEEGNPSYKSVDTFYLQGYEVKAIQELSKRIEELERRLAS